MYGNKTKSKLDYKKISESVYWSYNRLEPFRRTNLDLIEEWVGNRYSDETKVEHKALVNHLALAVETFSVHMIPQRPQVNITSDYPDHKPTAATLKVAINHEIEEMNLEYVLEEIILNAWLRMGVAKIGYSSGNYMRVGNDMIDQGQLFVQSVSLDNWVHDMSCNDFSKCNFYGDRYLITQDELREMPLYDSKVHNSGDTMSLDTLESDNDRIRNLSSGSQVYMDRDIHDKVEVWDIYLPREKKMVTFCDNQDLFGGKPLKEINWTGPATGPYKFLRFGRVPENSMPMAVGPQLMDLNKQMNNLRKKSLQQARQKKNVFGFKNKSRHDAERVRDAADGDIIAMDDPTAVQQFKLGEIDQQITAQILMLDQAFDRQAGNLSLMGGLGASADTVGQEQLLQSNSSARMNLYKGKVRGFISDIAKDIAWWRWHDREYNPVLHKPVDGTPLKVETRLERIGEFLNYNFDIEPYSLSYSPPEVKLSRLTAVINQLTPFLPVMQQQGIGFNFTNLIRMYSEYSNLPELMDVLETLEPDIHASQSMERPTQSPNTTRNYVRENRSSGNGQQGTNQMLAQLMNSSQGNSNAN